MTRIGRINYLMLIAVFLLFFVFSAGIAKPQPQDQQWEVSVSVKKKQKHYLNILKSDQVVKSFSVDKLSQMDEFDHIDDVKILTHKKVNGVYYILFWYEYRSNPSAKPGRGFCGAGYEEFVASLQLNNDFNVLKFKPEQVSSCIKSLDKVYKYNKHHPEYGFRITDRPPGS